ncbi:MAG: hypothetical protein RL329_1237 [Bacteroidota bacterium]
MLIQLKNFGPISYFEFDTEKQMHFIFGENNIGKSYAISAVYLILKNISNNQFYADYPVELEEAYALFVKNIQKKISLNKDSVEIDITKESKIIFKLFFKYKYLIPIQQSFFNTYDDFRSLKNEFSQKNSEIILKFESGEVFNIVFDEHQLIANEIEFKTSLVNFKTSQSEPTYHVEKSGNHIKIHGNIKKERIFLIEQLNRLLLGESFGTLKKYYDKLYFLPASRSGLYNSLNSFSVILATLSQNKTRINTKFNLPEMSEQVSDYFLNLSNIKKDKKTNPFSEIAQLIEQKVLKGFVRFNYNNKRIYFQPEKTAISLELSNTSSMISEIAPLVAHLKYIIDSENIYSHNILFIEEPEAHLHPKIQVELMKIFALLAQKGLKIVMTSHSNYLFNKLSNMILAKEIDPSTIRVAHMKLGEMGSYVDENSMQVDEDGIDDDNFSETAEALYLERMKLYKQNH